MNFYDRHGSPITDGQWLAAIRDDHYRTVGLHLVAGLVVSTVWLGFDGRERLAGQDGHFPGFIFESIVTTLGTGQLVEVRRYLSQDDARHGHRELVELFTERAARVRT